MKVTTGMLHSTKLLLLALLLAAFLAPAERLPSRKPLRKPDVLIQTGPANNIGRVDYDPRTGDYIFQWQGLDGKPKRAVYVPPWKAIVTVTAEVRPQEEGGFHYSYVVENAPKSPQAVELFYIEMSRAPQKVRVPDKWRFRGVNETVVGKLGQFSTYDAPLKPGSSLKFEFLSPFPPGTVKCYASGDTPMMRVPEELPGELEDRLPKGGMAGSYLRGLTLAPIENPSFARLVSDWNSGVKEGWVREEWVSNQVTQDLKNVLQLVEVRRYRQVAEKVSEIIRFARQNQKLLEPEAQALLVITLPYLTKKLQRGTL